MNNDTPKEETAKPKPARKPQRRPGPSVRVSTPSLRRTLDRVQQRMKLIGNSSGLIWGTFGFFVVLLSWMWIDVILDLPPFLRILAWITSFCVMFTLIVKTFLQTRQRSSHAFVATRLDQVANTGGEILTGLDLWVSGRQKKVVDTVSAGLAELAVQQASRKALRVSEEEAVPAKPLFQSALSMLGLFLFVLILVVLLPRMAKTELVRFVLPYGDQPAWSQYQFIVTPEATEVIYSETLDLTAEVYGPGVDSVELVLIPPLKERSRSAEEAEPIDVLPMFPDHEGIWHASIANVTDPFDYFLRVRRARSRSYQVEVKTVPQIRNIEVEITPPIYTGLGPSRGKMPPDGILGLPETQVQVTVTSNRPLSGGALNLIYDQEETVAMTALEDPRQVTGTFRLSRAGALKIKVTDEEGQDSLENDHYLIQILEDQHPLVRLIQPQAVSFASPTVMLPVIISAEDDYGLQKCELFRSLNDSRFLPTSIPLPEGVPRRAQVQSMLPFASYGLQPGDVVKLFARIEDNDPNGMEPGVGKGTESSIVTIRIVAEQDLNRMQQQRAGMQMLMNKYQQAGRRLENLSEQIRELTEKLNDLPEDSPLADELRDQLKQLGEEMKKEAEMMEKLSEQNLPFDVDQKLSPQLQEMAEMLRKLGEEAEKAAENENLTKEEMQELLKKQGEILQNEQQKHDEERMKPLEMLNQVQPLKQDEKAFQQIVQRQRQLAERLSALKNYEGHDDPAKKARLRELEEEQRGLRNKLSDLLDKIEEHAEALDDDERLDNLRETARDFVQQVRDSGATESMVDAEDGMGQFSGSKGHEKAEDAAEKLEKFLSKSQQMGNEAGDALPGFHPGLGKSLQNTLEQLTQGMGKNQGREGGQGGSGGESSAMDTLDNVGMYGGNPLMDPTESRSGMSDSNNPTATVPGMMSKENGDDGSGFETSQSSPAYGGAEWGVPLRYQRQAGRYLQKLAEELEE